MGLMFYKESATGNIVCHDIGETMYGSTCADIAKSVFSCRRFAVYYVGDFSCLKYTYSNPKWVETHMISRNDLPEEIKMYLLLLGESL